MKADLFIKAVLFLEHWLNNCSAEQYRVLSSMIYKNVLRTDEEPWRHLDQFLDDNYDFARDATPYLPQVHIKHIINLLVLVDKFYVDGDWDDIIDASKKLKDMFEHRRNDYDVYDAFFFDFSWDYGDTFRSCRLLYEDPIPDDE